MKIFCEFRPYLRPVVLAVVALLVLSACAPGQKPSSEDTTLRMGLLPILDTLPFYVADEKGYFEEEGISVELVSIKGAQERDALMQAGEIDGMLTDLIAVGIFNRDAVQVQVVATSMRATPQAPVFRVLAAPESGSATAQDLVGKPIGISRNTIIEYVTDRLLAAEGLSPDQIETVEVSAIPVRFEQLMASQINAATLPDPLGQGAQAAGAALIVDDSRYPQYAQTVLAFDQAVMQSNPNTVKKFLKSWNRAVQDLNDNPEQYADLLVEKGRVPESIQGSYKMPAFPQNDLPSQAEWLDVVEWLQQKGLIDEALAYDVSVASDFVKD